MLTTQLNHLFITRNYIWCVTQGKKHAAKCMVKFQSGQYRSILAISIQYRFWQYRFVTLDIFQPYHIQIQGIVISVVYIISIYCGTLIGKNSQQGAQFTISVHQGSNFSKAIHTVISDILLALPHSNVYSLNCVSPYYTYMYMQCTYMYVLYVHTCTCSKHT